MVGVPRSSGCRICVQRRVRCDGARPICNNCRKGNRPCPGYGPGVKFQDEGPKIREKYQKGQNKVDGATDEDDFLTWALTPKSNSPSAPTTPPAPGQWNVLGLDIEAGTTPARMNVFGFVEGKTDAYLDLDLFETLWHYNTMTSATPAPSIAEPTSILLTSMMSPEANQLQLLSNFTHSITPPEVKFMPKSMRAQATWLSQLPGLSGSSLLLDSTIRAVTLVHMGILHRKAVFIVESRPFYGKALRLLATAIADKEVGMDNKTLCATILLSFYEMFASSEDASWVRHAGGAATLMRMRGPARHRYGFDRDIFLAYRHTLVIEAMSTDVPSFLDEPEWRALSREIYNDLLRDKVIPADRIAIFDVAEEFYSQLAAISVSSAASHHLEQRIKRTGMLDEEEIFRTYQQIQNHHGALQNLFERWKGTLELVLRWPPLKSVDDPVVSFQYDYSNVFVASLNVGFWTTLMLTNGHIQHLLTVLGLPTSTCVAENETYAMEACRSVDFMLTSSFLGPFFTIYALRYVFRVFKDGDIRRDWALCKLIEIGDRRMMFAKGEIGGAADGGCERPELFVDGARRRLAEYELAHRMKQSPASET